MQAFTIIFRIGFCLCLLATSVWAESTPPDDSEENYRPSPYTDYGTFNQDEEEDRMTRFFQYGRFFGISVAAGMEGASGNRGALWGNAIPYLEFQAHYWFDFDFALGLGLSGGRHSFTHLVDGNLLSSQASVLRVGGDIRYYLPVRDLSAALTFAGPHLIFGGGYYKKTISAVDQDSVDNVDEQFGVSGGAGLEFVIAPRSSYFVIQGLAHYVFWEDTDTAEYEVDGLADQNGLLITALAKIMFTW